jgi:hypothetical protein
MSDKMPTGNICGLEVSRLLLGGNMLAHCTHPRDLHFLSNLIAHYNTPEKLLETFEIAEENGINTLSVHCVPWLIELFVQHRKRGGKIKWIINPTADISDGLQEYEDQVSWLVDQGSDALYVWGVHSDPLFESGTPEVIPRLLEILKKHGVPGGVGAHAIGAIKYCEDNGVDADFYLKAFHHHDYPSAPKPEELIYSRAEVPPYFCKDPVAEAEFMKGVEKPWIAFKTMVAGSILPENAFDFVLRNGADFVLAGMFDYEVEHNANVIKKLFSSDLPRERPWRA